MEEEKGEKRVLSKCKLDSPSFARLKVQDTFGWVAGGVTVTVGTQQLRPSSELHGRQGCSCLKSWHPKACLPMIRTHAKANYLQFAVAASIGQLPCVPIKDGLSVWSCSQLAVSARSFTLSRFLLLLIHCCVIRPSLSHIALSSLPLYRTPGFLPNRGLPPPYISLQVLSS